MRKSNLLIASLFSVGFCAAASAQLLVGSAGNTTSQGNVSISWAIGEPMIGFAESMNHTIVAGFLQPDLITVTAIGNDPEKTFKVFPNPAHDRVIIKRGKLADQEVIIYDINGKTVTRCPWGYEEIEKELTIDEWTAGVYIIHVFENGNLVNESRLLKL